MTTHITKEGLLRVLTEDVSEPMRSFILARATELSENNPYHDFLGLASREPVAEVSAQDASPKDGPEPQQILVLNEQGVHAAIERTEDGKWKFSTYPDGSLFIRFPSPKDGWQPIATAPKGRQIIGVAPYGSRWSAHHLWFDTQVEEWTDIHSDQYFSPTQYMPLPETTK